MIIPFLFKIEAAYFFFFNLMIPNAANAIGNNANKLSAGTGLPLGVVGGNGWALVITAKLKKMIASMIIFVFIVP